ncbi:unnamed protein product [Allacma fusca]|uniref:Uncharacterized protein n=1 Tax=Allacma fusca TaxID=39272 RepID=A0A8J2P474_9HEXA|nr:unnamed protein product [Allacma fusca]
MCIRNYSGAHGLFGNSLEYINGSLSPNVILKGSRPRIGLVFDAIKCSRWLSKREIKFCSLTIERNDVQCVKIKEDEEKYKA